MIPKQLSLLLAVALAFTLACTAKPTPTPSPTGTPSPTQPVSALLTATLAPSPTPTETTAVPTPTAAGLRYEPAPSRDLYDLAQRLVVKDGQLIPRVVNPAPVSYSQGRQDTFQVTDIPRGRTHSVTATLHLVTEHAYWYVDNNVPFLRSALEQAARGFEEVVYPRVTGVFGSPPSPGVDNDVRLTILHTPLNGVAGYFSAADGYPKQVYPLSNQREMFYLDTSALTLGSDNYLGTLAHEFTHAIQFRADPSEEGWINEGTAEFGKRLAGFLPTFQSNFFFSNEPVSLTTWPMELASTIPYYGAVSLFIDYLALHHGAKSIGVLLEFQERGIYGVEAYLAAVGDPRTFRQVFGDWAVANYLNDPGGGPYSYPNMGIHSLTPLPLTLPALVTDTLPQYAARYYALPQSSQGLHVTFQGQPQTALIPQTPPSGSQCWWSNRGDSIDATLTRAFTLPGGQPAFLEYSLWYEIEEGWDFVYVVVSTDGGKTWDILEGQHTVPPTGALQNAFGPGYTGSSSGWLKDRVDLSVYAGRSILVRFEYVTDDALHGQSLCLDDVTLTTAGFVDDAESEGGGWEARGFLRVPYLVPQEYMVRLVHVMEGGSVVTDIPVPEDGRVTFTVDHGGSYVLIVAAINELTMRPAEFTLEVTPR
ncbi:MAG: immune inhibitor A [Chloroflexi bacterium]|nr:immune inhibitor A [Chloroflexota bacterium]